MANRSIPTALLLVLAAGACKGPPSQQAAEAPTADAIVRTADPYKRGFTDADFPRVKQIADGVYTYEQLRPAGDEKFTTVSMFVVTDDGVLVADGQGSVEETQRLVDHIHQVTDQPIKVVVIGSDHGDHTSGNSAFPDDVQYYATPQSIAAMKAMEAGRKEGQAAVPIPTHVVHDKETLTMGGKEIQLLFLGRAHTGGDMEVYLPKEKVLYMSEAFLNRVFPAMRSAYPSEWVQVLQKAAAMDVDVYVPAHGFVETPAILRQELDTARVAIQTVIDTVKSLHDRGLSEADAEQQANFGPLESWSLRSSQGPVAVRRVYMELDGKLPPTVQ